MAQTTKKGGAAQKVLGVGAALAAGAVAAYLLTGERGKRNRAKIKGWTAKLEKQATVEMAKLKKGGLKEYKAIIAKLAKQIGK